MANNNYINSDLDLRFTPTLSVGDVALRYNEQAVISSIRNLLNTNKYERPFQPDLASNLNALLFEPLSVITASLIENEITRVLNNYEPRARINNLSVSLNPGQDQFIVNLSVFIGNNTHSTPINLILTRTR